MLEVWGLKTLATDKRATAENMAEYMFDLLRRKGRLNITTLRLWETPTS
ncbi:6-carboxytetrahydropterin synthase [Neisseria arctica]